MKVLIFSLEQTVAYTLISHQKTTCGVQRSGHEVTDASCWATPKQEITAEINSSGEVGSSAGNEQPRGLEGLHASSIPHRKYPMNMGAKPQQCQTVAADHGLARRTPGRLRYTKSEVVLQFQH
jgi:hypothetical protein